MSHTIKGIKYQLILVIKKSNEASQYIYSKLFCLYPATIFKPDQQKIEHYKLSIDKDVKSTYESI